MDDKKRLEFRSEMSSIIQNRILSEASKTDGYIDAITLFESGYIPRMDNMANFQQDIVDLEQKDHEYYRWLVGYIYKNKETDAEIHSSINGDLSHVLHCNNASEMEREVRPCLQELNLDLCTGTN